MTDLRREVPFGLIEFTEDPRAYYVTAGGKRERYVSVTTFLGVLDKPALDRWREDTAVRNAVACERAGLLNGTLLENVADAIHDNVKVDLANAAGRGTLIHSLIENYVRSGEVPSPARFPAEHRGYVRSLLAWLVSADERGFEPEASEQLVAHPELKFAGRYDLRARLGGFSHLIDFKTNRHGRVWADHHYQPVAYAVAAMACGEEDPHQCTIVAIGPDGFEEMNACVGPAAIKGVLEAYRRQVKLEGAIRQERDRRKAA